MMNFLVKFSMKPDAAPIALKPRPIPYYLKELLQKWLDECIKEEIFEKIAQGEPVTWCSPLVVQPKPRYSAKQGQLKTAHDQGKCRLASSKQIHGKKQDSSSTCR